MSYFWFDKPKKPLIVAHRGSSFCAPENTLIAFKQAVKDGADAVELDVRLTKDNQLVVIHDSRIDRTTNGSGKTRDYTLSELKRFDAGSWFDEKYSSEKIPLLSEVFELLYGKIAVNVEIKVDRSKLFYRDIVSRCLDVIKYYNMQEYVLISSFNRRYLRTARNMNRKIALGFLYDPFHHIYKSPISEAKKIDAQYLILGRSGLRKRYVEEAHQKNILVAEFTVNTKLRAFRSLHYSVDAVITNRPQHIKELITSKKSPRSMRAF